MLRTLFRWLVGVGVLGTLALLWLLPVLQSRLLSLPAADVPSTPHTLAQPAAQVAQQTAEQSTVVDATLATAPLLHYQGRLLAPATGDAKPDGVYVITFRLYNVANAGAALWTESKNVTVSKGLFSTLLGDTTPLTLPAFNGQELYLSVQVAPDAEATPRQRLAHVAYAIRANESDKLDGQDASAFAPVAHTHTGAQIIDGSIGSLDLTDGAITTAKLSSAGASNGQVLGYNGANVAWTAVPSAGLLGSKVIGVSCQRLAAFNSTFSKVVDVGSFTKADASSIVEVTFNGRLYVESLAASTGAIFELRIDDTATTNVWARSIVKSAEVGGGGVQSSITGLFSGLATGVHTVSVWVQAASGGSGTDAFIDPGCWSSAHFVIQELK